MAPIVYTQQSTGISLTNVPVNYPQSFTHSTSIDSTGQFITITQRAYNQNILIPRRLSLKDYLTARSQIETLNRWREYVLQSLSGSSYQNQTTSGITIESPEIRSRAFRQIFGGETLSLNVTGQITIDGSIRNESKDQDRTALNQAPETSFQMKQTQQFAVTGKIGENVSILIDQDSERPFEFENAFRLEYNSDEDGILKSLRAGNISLSLPATQFVTFSAQNSGLFGIKSEIKVGKLDITAIASIEKGEKKKLNLSGGKQESTFQIQDYGYRRYTYFFLDDFYRNNYSIIDSLGNHKLYWENYITDINVYKSGSINDEIQGYAVFDPNNPDFSATNTYNGYFVRVDPSEYYLSRQLGYIIMNTPVQENEILAVAYIDSSDHIYGSIPADVNATDNIFKLIKTQEPIPSDATWNLEWKNVYYLGSRDIDREGFDVKIYFKVPAGEDSTTTKINGKVRGYLNIFGLDNIDENGNLKPNNIIDRDGNTLDLVRGELIFPNLRPFYPEGEDSDLPKEKWTKAIYDTTVDNIKSQQSLFYIEVNSSRRSANYSLGFNVIEGTEEVFLNDERLQKDVDYTINYTTGELTLLKEGASSPNAKIDINYESQRMFAVDKKTLMGARAEYTLWEESSQRSFIGATFLYLNQKTLDQRIRVGRDAPMQNIIWGANTALQFKPDFVTRALDNLPFLSTNAPSNLSFEAEIAQVIPNPNTLNSESTGDPDGVAYLDDFESAEQEISLSIAYSRWKLSSPPTSNQDSAKSEYMYRKGRLIWYIPDKQVPYKEIWPNREATSNFGGSTTQNVFTLQFSPNDTLNNKKTSWGGIQQPLSSGYTDQTNSRFLELWIQGREGRLHVDLGQISEDVIPNQSLNTENKKTGGFYNNQLDDDEDTGIDGVFGEDPPSYFYRHQEAKIEGDQASPYDFWDINGNKTKESNESWSYDNYKYEEHSTDYDRINGTEKNEAAFETRYPESEDMNDNGNIDLSNDYFEYSFDIDPAGPFIAGGHDDENGGWWLYRIPLNEPTKIVGNPDWSRIKHVRLWTDGVDQPFTVTFAEINLVGNEWKLLGVKSAGDSTYQMTDDSTMTIAVINTHDNPEYVSPPGVEGVIDPIQQIRDKEQSLVIRLNNLQSEATAIAQKQFYQPENLINYSTLKMYVHGGDYTHVLGSDSIEFFFQFGSDAKNEHYYEVRFLVEDGWNPENNSVEIDFETLSRLKLEMQTTGRNSISEIQPNGHTITIRGNPSLTNVRWLIAGIKNWGDEDFTGEIWLNELRISNIRKDKGIAMRISANIALSDFITINGNYSQKDADFHTVNEQFGVGANTRGGNINTSIQLHKLFPAQWGISIPVTANYTKSVQTPKFKPGSDILVNNNTTPDSILKTIQTKNEQQSVNVSFRKQTKSRNSLTRYLLDPISGSLNYTKTDNSNPQMKHSDNTTYSGSFSYNLSIGNQYYWQPFKWMGQNGILKKISQIQFYYCPSRIAVQANINHVLNDTESREGIKTQPKNESATRTISVNYQPFKALSFDYSRGQISKMDSAHWVNILYQLAPGIPTSTNQTINTNFRPVIFSWLTHNFKYSSAYQLENNIEMKSRGTNKNARINTSFTIDGQFNPKRLIQAFKKESSNQGSAPRQPVTQSQPDQEEENIGNQEVKKENNKPFPFLYLLSLVGKIIEKIDPITISYTNGKSANHYGILETPSFAYQIGRTLDPGVEFSENVTQQMSSNKSRSIVIRTGLNITSRLSASFDYNTTSSENQSTQTTGSIKNSAFLLKNKAIPFPNWSVTWRGLEKFPLFSRFARSVSISHTFSGNTTQFWNESSNDIIRIQTTRDFRPFLGFSLTFKNGMTANIQYTTTESIEQGKKYEQRRTRKTSTNISLTIKYSRKGGFTIPFLGGKKLENNIDFSLTFNKRKDSTHQSLTETSEYKEMADSKNWSLQPRINYTFSQTVQGGAYFEMGERDDSRTQKTTIKAFGLNAVISLSGS